jgi:hypothetical protein
VEVRLGKKVHAGLDNRTHHNLGCFLTELLGVAVRELHQFDKFDLRA